MCFSQNIQIVRVFYSPVRDSERCRDICANSCCNILGLFTITPYFNAFSTTSIQMDGYVQIYGMCIAFCDNTGEVASLSLSGTVRTIIDGMSC